MGGELQSAEKHRVEVRLFTVYNRVLTVGLNTSSSNLAGRALMRLSQRRQLGSIGTCHLGSSFPFPTKRKIKSNSRLLRGGNRPLLTTSSKFFSGCFDERTYLLVPWYLERGGHSVTLGASRWFYPSPRREHAGASDRRLGASKSEHGSRWSEPTNADRNERQSSLSVTSGNVANLSSTLRVKEGAKWDDVAFMRNVFVRLWSEKTDWGDPFSCLAGIENGSMKFFPVTSKQLT